MKRFSAAYLALFFALTYPSGMTVFSRFLGDSGDGFQNLWNIWWVKFSLFHLHTNPLYTRYLFFPGGASLAGHTISLASTVPAALLAFFVDVPIAHNLVLVFAFVSAGVFTSLLFSEFETGRIGAFIAGFIYTFSEYHFAHAVGHLQLITIQWLPLFLWSWLRLLTRPTLTRAGVAALAFLLVFFTDYYYALYAVIAGFLALVFRVIPEPAFAKSAALWKAIGLFSAAVLLVAAPFAWATIQLFRTPLTGAHSAFEFGANLLAPFVPGQFWRFHQLTEPIWSTFRTPAIEDSVHLGWAALILAAIGSLNCVKPIEWKVWFIGLSGVLFLLLSFGPELKIGAFSVPLLPGPYRLLDSVLPILRFGGVPARMIVMTTLSVAILAGLGVEVLLASRRRALLSILLIVGLIECLPTQLITTATAVPPLFERMRSLPRGYAVLDAKSRMQLPDRMYYQTHFELPTSDGYISREANSVSEAELKIQSLAKQGEWNYLCQNLGFRYVLMSGSDAAPEALLPIDVSEDLRLYDLNQRWACAVIQ